MKELILLRGLPGSGKSTSAKLLGAGATGVAHFETDMYFMKDGKYEFDASKLREAHQWCQNEVGHAMLLNHTSNYNDTIIVSNTFTQEWEMQAYFDLADRWDYRVTTLIVENRHGGENVHGVPADKLEQMKNRFEIKL
jgi:adenylate kinase family enzyme